MKHLHNSSEGDMIVLMNVKSASVYIFMENSKIFHEIYITIEMERFTEPLVSQSVSRAEL